MEVDEESFVASRASLQSRRERLARRSEQQTTQEQRPGSPDADAAAETSTDSIPVAEGSARSRRHSDTRSSPMETPSRADWARNSRDREYVQPKIVDQCDIVALSLIQSSSILSMEDDGNHSRCSRSLSGESNSTSLRRTMPARMRSSCSERSQGDGLTAIEQPLLSGARLRRTSTDGGGRESSEIRNVEATSPRASHSQGKRHSGIGSDGVKEIVAGGREDRAEAGFARQEANGSSNLGWMPGNLGLTSRPVLSPASDEQHNGRERSHPERSSSEESREERIARYKEQRRRSRISHPLTGDSGDREIPCSPDSAVVHKRWHSLEDSKTGLHRGRELLSTPFFDPKRPASLDASLPVSGSLSCGGGDGAFGTADIGRKPRDETAETVAALEGSKSSVLCSDSLVTRSPAIVTSPGIEQLHVEPAGEDTSSQATTPDGKQPGAIGSTNTKRSARRRRSNMLAESDLSELTPTLHEVTAEAEAADAGVATVVTRPRRRRTADRPKSIVDELLPSDKEPAPRESSVLSRQWQQLACGGCVTAISLSGSMSKAMQEYNNNTKHQPDMNRDISYATPAEADSVLGGTTHDRLTASEQELSASADCKALNGSVDTNAVTDSAGCIGNAPTKAWTNGHTPQNYSQLQGHANESGHSAADAAATQSKEAIRPATLCVTSHRESGHSSTNQFYSQSKPSPQLADEVSALNPDALTGAKTCSDVANDTRNQRNQNDTGSVAENKSRSGKKAAVLGLILQKFEAANNGLPSAIAAVIGLPSPTSACSKKLPPSKSGKVESTIKQMALHHSTESSEATAAGSTQPADNTLPHQSASSSVESLVRRFAGTTPPGAVHMSLVMATDSSCSEPVANKARGPSRPASPANQRSFSPANQRPVSPVCQGAASPANQSPSTIQQRINGLLPSPGPKDKNEANAPASSHSSPGSHRKSPAALWSPSTPNALATVLDSTRQSDSDASSLLTDDGLPSDSANNRPPRPAIKPSLQSPVKAGGQQPYFSAAGKKLGRTTSSPVTPVAATVVPQEPASEHGQLFRDQLQGEKDEAETHDVRCQHVEPALSTLIDVLGPAIGAASSTKVDQVTSFNADAAISASEPIDSEHPLGLTNRTATYCSSNSSSCGHEPAQPAAPDIRDDRDTSHAVQFAKLRAAPAPDKRSAAKSEAAAPLLDPQLANILQARLKRVENKTPAHSLKSSTLDDSKPSQKEESVERATQSIKDKTLYFLQMQQKSQSTGNEGIATQRHLGSVPTHQPGGSGRVATAATAATAAAAAAAPANESHDSGRESQVAISPVGAVPQETHKEKHRRARGKRKGLPMADESNRWQTQPVTDSEVLVAAAAVRGQAASAAAAAPGNESQSKPADIGVSTLCASNMDEVRRLAVMTLEEKIGLFMDRSIAWPLRDEDPGSVSPDPSARCQSVKGIKGRRAARRGRYSTQPVSGRDLRRSLNALGTLATAPVMPLDSVLNQRISALYREVEKKNYSRNFEVGAKGLVGDETKEPVMDERAPIGQRSSIGVNPQSKYDRQTDIVHRRYKSDEQTVTTKRTKQQLTSKVSPSPEPHHPSRAEEERRRASRGTNSTGNAAFRRSGHQQSSYAPRSSTRAADKSEKQRAISMHGSSSMQSEAVGEGARLTAAAADADDADDASGGSVHTNGHTTTPVRKDRPLSARTPDEHVRTKSQDATRARSRTKSGDGGGGTVKLSALPSFATAASQRGHRAENVEPVNGGDRSARGQEKVMTEVLTWAEKSRSQPCISIVDDEAADDLPSYMRATTSYARKVEHLLAESGDDDTVDDDRSSSDVQRHDAESLSSPFHRAGINASSKRASGRPSLSQRLSTGTQPEEMAAHHRNGDVHAFTRATKAMSMKDIRTAGKLALSFESDGHHRCRLTEMDQAALVRPASATLHHGAEQSGSDDEDLPSYMRATKSYALKVEHLVESCDEEDKGIGKPEEHIDVIEYCGSGKYTTPTAAASRSAKSGRPPSMHAGFELSDTPDFTSRDHKQSHVTSDRLPKGQHELTRGVAMSSFTAAASQELSQRRPRSSGRDSHNGLSSKSKPSADVARPKVVTPSARRGKLNGATSDGKEGADCSAPFKTRNKDKHVLIGGELPSFMRATKSSSTKDKHISAPANDAGEDHATVAKKSAPEHVRKQNKGQGSRESLSSVGASSGKAESGRQSSCESADPAPHADAPTDVQAAKSRKSLPFSDADHASAAVTLGDSTKHNVTVKMRPKMQHHGTTASSMAS